ncbi:hypothetical protein M2352_001824 [Azospirillum fermentarium]|uniref:hypothetical protein n=1 Tax=Azospirillum fermentarium TaxID=1233114 RepID=UPI002226CF27|nr:hypothetical protein [Azospirillum fermentarium]MCW2246233.1 hypothetical protein [Azospirillum fermentarium]
MNTYKGMLYALMGGFMRNFIKILFFAAALLPNVSFAASNDVLGFLQGGWSVNCSSPPHLWRIFLDDKSIGPVPALEKVVQTEVQGKEIFIKFSDGYMDQFQIIDNNLLKYIAQYGPSGNLYKDWSSYSDIYLHRCETKQDNYGYVPAFYRDGWSVDCSRPRSKWRVYDNSNSYGPGNQSYYVSSTFVSGPVLKINYADGDGEVFVNIDNNKLRYIYDFNKYGRITKNYTKDNIVLNRCGSANTYNPGLSVQVPQAPSFNISNERKEKVTRCVAETLLAGVVKAVIPALGEDPNLSALVDTVASGIVNNQQPTARNLAENVALSHTEHYFAEKGSTVGVLATKAAGFANCALN